jgi:hypothetical protein
MTSRKTLKQYEAEDKVRSLRMLAARKRKAAERAEARAERFRTEATALDVERDLLVVQHKLAS